MCPLRFILIFLSATLAAFLLVRNLKSDPRDDESDHTCPNSNNSLFSKFRSALQSAFWTTVDMASGRYLWKHFVSSPPAD